ncbi:hypothetical protein QVD17_27201 [Tagetes erecta]|uniref:NAC domain-containing protein n=1 Tax=Tagetes erecta TaxID=13708 RepID=A0AAD8K8P0_TARER|nr:hypothetical protein QVD17_27201 [Tagetes erecta]
MVVPVPLTDPTAQLRLPAGFRFYPTDEELMVNYLLLKVAGHNFPLQIIGDVDLYKFDPWDLPSKAMFGDKEWYFFSPRDRKYPNGFRPNRVAGSGYWKATGTDKAVMSGRKKVGVKKALVFYVGKAPRGSKTNWIMHEYRLSEPSANNNGSRLDDWVLCRIYRKSSSIEKTVSGGSPSSQSEEVLDSFSSSIPANDDKFLNFSTNNSMKTINCEDQKDVDSGNYDWMSVVSQDSIDDDSTFNMQNGIRSERMEDTGYLFDRSSEKSNDPFAIRYPTRESGSGYEQ